MPTKPLYLQSPFGLLRVFLQNGKLRSLDFIGAEKFKQNNSKIIAAEAEQLIEELNSYFKGNRKVFGVTLEIEGTKFQKSVWQQLQQIPYGQTRSYRQIAEQIGNPDAARAVGMACHQNPIAIIIPCHRVVGSSGKLTGYASGLDIKQSLLVHEKLHC